MTHLISNDNFKDFLIFKWEEEESLAILEFVKIEYNYDQITNKLLYSYKNNNLEKHKPQLFAILFEDVDDILYQSNSLDECLKKIEFINDTDKYNL